VAVQWLCAGDDVLCPDVLCAPDGDGLVTLAVDAAKGELMVLRKQPGVAPDPVYTSLVPCPPRQPAPASSHRGALAHIAYIDIFVLNMFAGFGPGLERLGRLAAGAAPRRRRESVPGGGCVLRRGRPRRRPRRQPAVCDR
jgi:hypothetical protein